MCKNIWVSYQHQREQSKTYLSSFIRKYNITWCRFHCNIKSCMALTNRTCWNYNLCLISVCDKGSVHQIIGSTTVGRSTAFHSEMSYRCLAIQILRLRGTPDPHSVFICVQSGGGLSILKHGALPLASLLGLGSKDCTYGFIKNLPSKSNVCIKRHKDLEQQQNLHQTTERLVPWHDDAKSTVTVKK
jgi:hypothetical protein